jgi:ribosomal protein L39E
MARKKDNAIKIKICILNKQNSSINFSIRLKDGVTKEEVNKKIDEFLKEKL